MNAVGNIFGGSAFNMGILVAHAGGLEAHVGAFTDTEGPHGCGQWPRSTLGRRRMMSQAKVTASERQRMIAEVAYFKAERRGFTAGDSLRDWCEAEAEVDARLRRLEVEDWLDRLEEGMAVAAKRMTALKRKMAGMSSDARAEWQRDVDRLKTLREALQPTLAELRKHGEDAGAKLREQAERLRTEIADVLARAATRRAKH